MNDLGHSVFLITKQKCSKLCAFTSSRVLLCLVLHHNKAVPALSWCNTALCVSQATLTYFCLWYISMPAFPCQETLSDAGVWVWARTNDWQASSSSCKSGSGTRVEPLHLSCWIHICTAYSPNYNNPSVCICVCADVLVHWTIHFCHL